MTPVYDYPDEVKAFVAKGIFPPGREFGLSTAIGFANETEGLVAGVVYHNYEPDSQVIELSAYSTRRNWLTRDFLRIIYRYPFDELECRLAVARCSRNNRRVLRIWKALGARLIALPDFRADGEDEVVALLKADAWRNSKFMR